MKKRPITRKMVQYDPKHAITAGILAYKGATDADIQRHIGVSPMGFRYWCDKRPLFKYALTEGRAQKASKEQTFSEWVPSRLSKPAKQVWDQIMFWKENEDVGADKIDKLLAEQTIEMKMRMWLYAFMTHRFSKSAASRVTGIPLSTVKVWINKKEFRMMFNEIETLKKDYFEEALVGLVQKGDSGAIQFVNRTINKDRGYGDKLEVAHTGQINVEHRVEIDSLLSELSLECRQELLAAMRKHREAQENPGKALQSAKEEPIEVETEEVEDDE